MRFLLYAKYLICPEQSYPAKDTVLIGPCVPSQACLNSSGIQTQLAVCSVSGPEVVARGFKFPALLPKEVAGAVQFEAAQVCPFEVSGAAVDYQSIYNDAESTQGFLVAATDPIIESKKQLVENAHLNCCLMDVDGLALLNCFNECEKSLSQEPVAILNVGASLTNLVIKGSSNLPFIRDIAFGGNDIIQLIVDEKNVSAEIVTAILFDPANGTLDQPDIIAI